MQAMVYPARLDMTVLQGATFYKRITWTVGDGTPFDLRDCTIRMQARQNHRDDEVLIEATTENGKMVIENGEGGVFSINLAATETDSFQFQGAIYDLEVETPTGEVYRPLQGSISVQPQVTR